MPLFHLTVGDRGFEYVIVVPGHRLTSKRLDHLGRVTRASQRPYARTDHGARVTVPVGETYLRADQVIGCINHESSFTRTSRDAVARCAPAGTTASRNCVWRGKTRSYNTTRTSSPSCTEST